MDVKGCFQIMPIGDQYKLILSGNLLGQTVKNIFHYRNDVADGFADELLGAFQLTVLPTILTALSSFLTYTNIDVINLDNGADFATEAFGVPGARGGEVYDSFGAYGFTLFPNVYNYKAGAKRFPGVAEADVSNGTPVASQLTRLDNIAVDLGAVLISGAKRFRPQLFSHRCVKNPTTHKCTDVFTDSFVTVATAAWDRVTTQNSRKRGVGV